MPSPPNSFASTCDLSIGDCCKEFEDRDDGDGRAELVVDDTTAPDVDGKASYLVDRGSRLREFDDEIISWLLLSPIA